MSFFLIIFSKILDRIIKSNDEEELINLLHN